MPSRIGTDPHVDIGRRYRKHADAIQYGRSFDAMAARIDIDKPLALSPAVQPGLVVAHIDQALRGGIALRGVNGALAHGHSLLMRRGFHAIRESPDCLL